MVNVSNLPILTQTALGRRAGIDEESASSRVSQCEKETYTADFKLVCKFAVVPDAYFYAVYNDLVELILKYHKFKKTTQEVIF